MKRRAISAAVAQLLYTQLVIGSNPILPINKKKKKMTHFEWSVDYLKKYSSLGEHSNIVYVLGYTCIGINTEGTIRTEYGKGGEATLSTDNLSSPIPYEDLTEADVRGWLSGVKSSVENIIEGQINGSDDVEIRNFPWNS